MSVWIWTAFIVIILGALALDLGVFHRRAKTISIAQSAAWTTLWVALALLFNVAVYYIYENRTPATHAADTTLTGQQAALQFFTGYVIEKSLSLDNIFVIAMIFAYFGVPGALQHRVLFWGILGALVMRGVMIAAGAALIERFAWMSYVLGALLLVTAAKLLVTRHDRLSPDRNVLVRLTRRVFPVSTDFHDSHFFIRIDGRLAVTPLFIALVVVESTDLLFAVDSIPAVFAVTRDPFLVFTSNVFAILGLRSLYFVLAGVLDRFRYLKTSLVFVLAYVGVKMLLAHHYPIPTLLSLGVISGILSIGFLASLLAAHLDRFALQSPLTADLEELAAVTWRQVRRIFVLLAGVTLLLVGLAMIVLPGPALVAIPAGLAILGTEFLWARYLFGRIRDQAGVLKRLLRGEPTGVDPPGSDANK